MIIYHFLCCYIIFINNFLRQVFSSLFYSYTETEAQETDLLKIPQLVSDKAEDHKV